MLAIEEPLAVSRDIDLYEIDGRHLAERARQDIIQRYGLTAYKNGWSVYTTLNSKFQQSARKNVLNQLAEYYKRHGWKKADNYIDLFNEEQISYLEDLNIDFIADETTYFSYYEDDASLPSRISKVFESLSLIHI